MNQYLQTRPNSVHINVITHNKFQLRINNFLRMSTSVFGNGYHVSNSHLDLQRLKNGNVQFLHKESVDDMPDITPVLEKRFDIMTNYNIRRHRYNIQEINKDTAKLRIIQLINNICNNKLTLHLILNYNILQHLIINCIILLII